MTQEFLIKRYKQCKSEHIKLIDLDATALAGYYLFIYPCRPIEVLLMDINELNISNTVGQSAKVIITAVLSRERMSYKSR